MEKHFEQIYNKNVSEKVKALSEKIESAKDAEEVFDSVCEFYKSYGVGMFGLNKAFRLAYGESGVRLSPITNMEKVMLYGKNF